MFPCSDTCNRACYVPRLEFVYILNELKCMAFSQYSRPIMHCRTAFAEVKKVDIKDTGREAPSYGILRGSAQSPEVGV